MFSAARLTVARLRRQVTKKALADDAKISPLTFTRLESGQTIEPTDETVAAIAKALDYPATFFTMDDELDLAIHNPTFRRASNVAAKKLDAVLQAGYLAFPIEKALRGLFDLPELDLLDLRGENDPETAALSLREHWGIGIKPIGNLIKVLESKGIRVFGLAENTKSIDAFACWHEDRPFMFLNTFKSAERSRFDAAHELGHLVLHKHGHTEVMENEADRFAAAFLMPKEDVIAQLDRRMLSVSGLIKAKKRWGVSLAALARTARTYGLISDWHYRDICRQIAIAGYRTKEPEPMARDVSHIWRIFYTELWRKKVTREEFARSLNMPIDELHSLIDLLLDKPAELAGTPGLRLVA
jgi:Zn-dependent peptidase ImmA (M78 family)/DNA-binding Xre family transcriptional regulator